MIFFKSVTTGTYGSPAVCVSALLPVQPVTWFAQHTHTHTQTNKTITFFYNGKI